MMLLIVTPRPYQEMEAMQRIGQLPLRTARLGAKLG
jgi:hypothetical protein